MNENENNFDSLRQLLKLKRQENPPPGYFNNFSSRVTARIRAGEAIAGGSAAERLAVEAPWLMKFLQFFEAKPAFAGGFALALCLLLLGGIVFADRSDVEQSSPAFVDATPTATIAAPAVVALDQPTPSLTDSLTQDGGLAVSTNYSPQPVATLFGQSPFVQQVGYTPSGN
jgi:hypothetical protein